MTHAPETGAINGLQKPGADMSDQFNENEQLGL